MKGVRGEKRPAFLPVKLKINFAFRYAARRQEYMTPEERKVLYKGESVKIEEKNIKMASHVFVKTDGFEKTIAFIMTLTKTIWELMQKRERFCMVLEYDTEALNVNIDCLEEVTVGEDDSHPENQ